MRKTRALGHQAVGSREIELSIDRIRTWYSARQPDLGGNFFQTVYDENSDLFQTKAILSIAKHFLALGKSNRFPLEARLHVLKDLAEFMQRHTPIILSTVGVGWGCIRAEFIPRFVSTLVSELGYLGVSKAFHGDLHGIRATIWVWMAHCLTEPRYAFNFRNLVLVLQGLKNLEVHYFPGTDFAERFSQPLLKHLETRYAEIDFAPSIQDITSTFSNLATVGFKKTDFSSPLWASWLNALAKASAEQASDFTEAHVVNILFIFLALEAPKEEMPSPFLDRLRSMQSTEESGRYKSYSTIVFREAYHLLFNKTGSFFPRQVQAILCGAGWGAGESRVFALMSEQQRVSDALTICCAAKGWRHENIASLEKIGRSVDHAVYDARGNLVMVIQSRVKHFRPDDVHLDTAALIGKRLIRQVYKKAEVLFISPQDLAMSQTSKSLVRIIQKEMDKIVLATAALAVDTDGFVTMPMHGRQNPQQSTPRPRVEMGEPSEKAESERSAPGAVLTPSPSTVVIPLEPQDPPRQPKRRRQRHPQLMGAVAPAAPINAASHFPWLVFFKTSALLVVLMSIVVRLSLHDEAALKTPNP